MKNKHHFKIDSNLSLKKKEPYKDKKEEQDSFFALAKYSSIGYYLVTPLLVGVFFGLLIDKLIKSSPYGVLFGLLLGTFATFYNLFKLTKEN
ncbi:hypothetical protein A2690_01380 [Candidatus Roizmanbacteria bacterium RIFCSPHIGHO2_01_FULL_39_12b]|uniref:ATP synthase subunit n=1 Tax=Candidatus Roizmanbacteria bacterium RIFCSPHIGHO2_01_FULL_39_12b TaxID=1802030 RepID=A0A1F7GAW8_9BACT|nr:MAG: hypothetical protein A2690_01380 [Candidatus Roizmanbacteria bacterium RIFCSPHIGHO2_01_FULL_39_12b]OGK46092.1 MAG: hypothetical protein A3B46_01285 [Candidatus Roizmanbacteria bacterium RIFCSPLOWO2_01_FULL_39_19]